ncbi:hypothetical protein [Ramlibacter albus]|uniref:Uncharacterized protein n=1 Tax=Ramlibacter albus TaxID=2079448 RepID=A0A923S4Q9_9BURK|nr:hypothetical protein [Ramlibacter albus]MBC5767780.1 hypothetical protein [Ramlibacter albus]
MKVTGAQKSPQTTRTHGEDKADKPAPKAHEAGFSRPPAREPAPLAPLRIWPRDDTAPSASAHKYSLAQMEAVVQEAFRTGKHYIDFVDGIVSCGSEKRLDLNSPLHMDRLYQNLFQHLLHNRPPQAWRPRDRLAWQDCATRYVTALVVRCTHRCRADKTACGALKLGEFMVLKKDLAAATGLPCAEFRAQEDKLSLGLPAGTDTSTEIGITLQRLRAMQANLDAAHMANLDCWMCAIDQAFYEMVTTQEPPHSPPFTREDLQEVLGRMACNEKLLEAAPTGMMRALRRDPSLSDDLLAHLDWVLDCYENVDLTSIGVASFMPAASATALMLLLPPGKLQQLVVSHDDVNWIVKQVFLFLGHLSRCRWGAEHNAAVQSGDDVMLGIARLAVRFTEEGRRDFFDCLMEPALALRANADRLEELLRVRDQLRLAGEDAGFDDEPIGELLDHFVPQAPLALGVGSPVRAALIEWHASAAALAATPAAATGTRTSALGAMGEPVATATATATAAASTAASTAATSTAATGATPVAMAPGLKKKWQQFKVAKAARERTAAAAGDSQTARPVETKAPAKGTPREKAKGKAGLPEKYAPQPGAKKRFDAKDHNHPQNLKALPKSEARRRLQSMRDRTGRFADNERVHAHQTKHKPNNSSVPDVD